MTEEINRGFWWAAAVHVGVAFLFILSSLLSSLFQPTIRPHVFQLIGAINDQGGGSSAKVAPGPASLPEFKATPTNEPEPAPPVTTTASVVEKTPPAPIENVLKTAPKDAVVKTVTKTPAAKVNYETFIKQYGQTKVKTKKQVNPINAAAKTSSAGYKAAREAVKAWSTQGAGGGSGGGNGFGYGSGKGAGGGYGVGASAQGMSALEAYIQQLYEKINRIWQRPHETAGLGLSAKVEFKAKPDGSLSMRLTSSSGNTAFDRSIEAAFAALGRLQIPKEATAYTFSLTFKERIDEE